MEQEKKQAVALMRYSAIAPLITGTQEDYESLQHIRRCADKGCGDEIEAVLNAKNNILPVAFANKGHGEVDVRHIDALIVGDKAMVWLCRSVQS